MFTIGCVVYAKPEANREYGVTNTNANGMMRCVDIGADWIRIKVNGERSVYSVSSKYFFVPKQEQKYINSVLKTGGNI